MNKQSPEHRRIYTLCHWKLVREQNQISIEGHLHGREGFSDGLNICTSPVCRWQDDYKEGILFETMNSRYYCPLADFAGEADLLALLDEGKIKAKITETQMDRMNHYRSFIDRHRDCDVTILNWYGTDHPYLRWIVYDINGKMSVEDNLHLFREKSVQINIQDSACPVVYFNAQNRIAVPLKSSESHSLVLYLENSGCKAIEFNAGTIIVKPGEIQRIQS